MRLGGQTASVEWARSRQARPVRRFECFWSSEPARQGVVGETLLAGALPAMMLSCWSVSSVRSMTISALPQLETAEEASARALSMETRH